MNELNSRLVAISGLLSEFDYDADNDVETILYHTQCLREICSLSNEMTRKNKSLFHENLLLKPGESPDARKSLHAKVKEKIECRIYHGSAQEHFTASFVHEGAA